MRVKWEGVLTLEKDRGMKKWYGFSIPEHGKMLKDMRLDYYKTPRPILDEGQIEEMEQVILESHQNKSLLEITTWENGFFTTRVGTVSKIDELNNNIKILDELDSFFTLNFFNITKVYTK